MHLFLQLHLPLKHRMFPRVGAIGPMGNDFLEEDLRLLDERGINIEGISKIPGKPSDGQGRYEGTMDDAQTISTEINVLGGFNPKIPNFGRMLTFCSVQICIRLLK